MGIMMLGSGYVFFVEVQENFLIMRHGVPIEAVITDEYECRTSHQSELHICVKYRFELENPKETGFKKYIGSAHLWNARMGEHTPGSKLKIFYYPKDPNISDTFFEDGQQMARYYAGNAFSVVLLFIGLFFLVSAGRDFKVGKSASSYRLR